MKIVVSVCAILFTAIPMIGQSTGLASEEARIRQTVESYINKTDQSVLHPEAKIFAIDGMGNRLVESEFRPAKLRKGETIGVSTQQVLSIDVSEDGAVAKVETRITPESGVKLTPARHIQYISLLKIKGEWRIVSILMPPLRFVENR